MKFHLLTNRWWEKNYVHFFAFCSTVRYFRSYKTSRHTPNLKTDTVIWSHYLSNLSFTMHFSFPKHHLHLPSIYFVAIFHSHPVLKATNEETRLTTFEVWMKVCYNAVFSLMKRKAALDFTTTHILKRFMQRLDLGGNFYNRWTSVCFIMWE